VDHQPPHHRLSPAEALVVDNSTKIFHESWYRIASQRVSLRASVCIHRQFFRGTKWYVLHDPFSNQYYRLQQAAYEFVSRLSHKKTIEQVWQQLLQANPETAPGQGEVIELLAQLYQANMLHYDQAQDSLQLFERKQKRTKQLIKSTLFNILYLKLPLFDPNAILRALTPLIRLIFSKVSLAIWLILIIYAGKLALDHFDAIQDGAQAAFAPSNLFLVYLTGVVIKAIHEFGHSCAVRRFGGEVHTIGLMFMLLAPLPYMDATASWSFRSKWQRILVSSSGMFFEFFVASIAIIVWANVGGGTIKAIAYNTLTIASVTTLLFNINPLMKFDGYYILCDLLDMPNLQQHAHQHIKYLLERYAFKKSDAHTPANSFKESVLFATYGILSSLYKFVIFGGILLVLSQHYLLLALFMSVILFISWLVMPVYKFLHYLFGPQLQRVRNRALAVSFVFLTTVVLALTFIPVPDTFTAPGILLSTKEEFTIPQTSGVILAVMATPGQKVTQGDSLLLLANPELLNQISGARANLQESRSKFYLALSKSPEDMEPIIKRISVLEQQLAQLETDRMNLLVRASISGIWASPEGGNLKGRWVVKGDSLGEIIDTTSFHFVAVIPQDEVSRLFAHPSQNHIVRLKGDASKNIRIGLVSAIPMEQSRLPSAALGWFGGGDIEVNNAKGDPQETTEPFYEIHAVISGNPAEVSLYQGRSGKIRFHLGYRPLLPQLVRIVQQKLQKYYRI
jgi:putative peptide zinc metalloprotease protein